MGITIKGPTIEKWVEDFHQATTQEEAYLQGLKREFRDL